METIPTKKGRPATGRSTKVVRVPMDFDVDLAMRMYYDWLPIIENSRETLKGSPRYEQLCRLLNQLG